MPKVFSARVCRNYLHCQGSRVSVASAADSMVSVDDEDVEKNLLKAPQGVSRWPSFADASCRAKDLEQRSSNWMKEMRQTSLRRLLELFAVQSLSSGLGTWWWQAPERIPKEDCLSWQLQPRLRCWHHCTCVECGFTFTSNPKWGTRCRISTRP